MVTPVYKIRCPRCDKFKSSSDFLLYKTGKHSLWCRLCKSDHRSSNPRQRMYASSRFNAKQKGVPHTVRAKDIPLPEVCVYLGIIIDYRKVSERGSLRSHDGPSIDRIVPSLGYVPGNIQVISDLANRMKQNATIEQLVAFAHGVIREHGG